SFLYGSSRSQFKSVKFNAGTGNDVLAVSTAMQDFNYTVDFDGGAGYNTVFFLCSAGDENFSFNGSNVQVNNAFGSPLYNVAFDNGLATNVSEFDINPMGG